jgi:hypothetical protein
VTLELRCFVSSLWSLRGIDDVGRELICGVQEWVKWIGKTSGRCEIERLSETGGVDVERSGGGNVHFWRPSFMVLHGRQGGSGGKH